MSRQKGNGAEREVAKLLEAWWSQVEPGCRFVRTPLSGGWGGPDIRAGFNASGDLMTTASSFPWAVEVKRREAWVLHTLLGGKASPVWGWWRQAQEAAAEMSKAPALFFRRNRSEWLLMLPSAALWECRSCGVDPLHTWGQRGLSRARYGREFPALFYAEAVLGRVAANRFAVVGSGEKGDTHADR